MPTSHARTWTNEKRREVWRMNLFIESVVKENTEILHRVIQRNRIFDKWDRVGGDRWDLLFSAHKHDLSHVTAQLQFILGHPVFNVDIAVTPPSNQPTDQTNIEPTNQSSSCGHKVFFSSVQLSSIWYLSTQESPYALHPISRKFPQCCSSNSSNVGLIDNDPVSSFRRRSATAVFLYASLLLVIGGVMSLLLCPQVLSQAPQHLGPSETQAICDGCFACQSIYWVFWY